MPSIQTVCKSHSLLQLSSLGGRSRERNTLRRTARDAALRCEVPDEGGDLRQCCFCDSIYCDSYLTTRGIDPKAEDGVCSTRCRTFNDAGLETNAAIEARFHLEGQNVARKKNVVLVAANR